MEDNNEQFVVDTYIPSQEDVLREVALDALPAVNAAADRMLSDHGYDVSKWQHEMPVGLDGHEVYLFVSIDGNWVIDHGQYHSAFQVYAMAWITHYDSASDLYDAL